MAFAECPLLNQACIRNALGGQGVTLHYDLSTMLRASPVEWRSVAGNVVALSTLVAPPTGAPAAMAGVYQVCQCVCIGVPEAELPLLAQALQRSTQYLRDHWNTFPENIRLIDGHEEYINPGEARRDVTLAELQRIVALISATELHPTTTVKCLVYGLLAYCKRGNVTHNVAQKVTQALIDEKRMTINIDPDVIRQVWNTVSARVTSDVIRPFMVVWGGALQGISLRLGLIVAHAKWQGLTSYKLIIDAKRAHPDFFWARLKLLVPEEFENFVNAHITIAGNPYYGFNPDLAAVKSTGYRTLAYAAYCLGDRVDGTRTLGNYKGELRNTPRARDVDEMINDYLQQRRNVERTPEQLMAAEADLARFRHISIVDNTIGVPVDIEAGLNQAARDYRRPPPPPGHGGGAGAGMLVNPLAQVNVPRPLGPPRVAPPPVPGQVNPFDGQGPPA